MTKMSQNPMSPPGVDVHSKTATAVGRVRGIWNFQGKYRTLHLTWFAFFLSFVVWFNFAPFANDIAEQFGLSGNEKKTIGLVNVALTVPARVFIGMALDRWGPRRVFSMILLFAAIPNTIFAMANTYETLLFSRLALSVVGAGFVVGIRMVSEWFPPKEVGTAEGVYGGWGNFGSAAAAMALPVIAAMLGGDEAWRWSIGSVGVVAAAYGAYYWFAVEDTPDGVAYARPRRQGALEVTSPRSVWALAALTVPINAILGVIAWRIWRVEVIDDTVFVGALIVVVALLLAQELAVFRVNRPALRDEYPPEDRYPVRSVAVLCLAYFATFGSELAIVSMLPTFFEDTWSLGGVAASFAASSFAFMNLGARPAGGLLSDLFGSRRRTLTVLLVGLVIGYTLMGTFLASWLPWGIAIGICMTCSFFVQSGEGAVFAIVPLVKKRVSGQVAGLAGAYGNVGALSFLTAGLFVSDRVFFFIIAGAAGVALVSSLFLVEPEHSFADDLLTDDMASAGRVVGSTPAGSETVAEPSAVGSAMA